MGVWGRSRNWGRNIRLDPAAVMAPDSVEGLAELIRTTPRVKPTASLHSFNAILATEGVAIRTHRLPRSVRYVGPEPGVQGRKRVRVVGHWPVGELYPALDALTRPVPGGEQIEGAALDSSGSNIRPSLIGALATASHGSGVAWGSMSHPDVLRGVEIVDGRGELRSLSVDEPADHADLRALRAHLGGMGVVTAVDLCLRDRYQLRLDLDAGTVAEALDPVQRQVPGRGYEVYWFPTTGKAFRITRDQTDDPIDADARLRAFWSESVQENYALQLALWVSDLWPRALVPRLRTLLAGLFPEDGDPYVDSWWQGLTGDRVFRAVSMEYGFAVDRVGAALEAVERAVRDAEARSRYWLDLPVNIRFTASDEDTCMSAAHGRPTAWVDVSAYAGRGRYGPLMAQIEAAFVDLGGRAHLGKVCWSNPRPSWDPEAWGHYWTVRDRYDPDERFMNDFLYRLRDGRDLDPGLPRSWSLRRWRRRR